MIFITIEACLKKLGKALLFFPIVPWFYFIYLCLKNRFVFHQELCVDDFKNTQVKKYILNCQKKLKGKYSKQEFGSKFLPKWYNITDTICCFFFTVFQLQTFYVSYQKYE